jgi:NTE family protein
MQDSRSLVWGRLGAKGAFQVGVLQYLLEQGLRVDAAYGTSVGALNIIGLAFQGIDGLVAIWKNIHKKSDIIKFNWSNLWLCADGIYNTKPLAKIIDRHVVGKPTIDATVCAVNLETGMILHDTVKRDHTIHSQFKKSVLASASIPFAMSPVDNVWVDGGVREITPLKQAIEDGAEKIVVILASPLSEDPEIQTVSKSSFLKMFKVGLRTIDIMSHEVFVNDIRQCLKKNNKPGYRTIEVEVYAPNRLVLNTYDFDDEKIKQGMEQGYLLAQKGSIL